MLLRSENDKALACCLTLIPMDIEQLERSYQLPGHKKTNSYSVNLISVFDEEDQSRWVVIAPSPDKAICVAMQKEADRTQSELDFDWFRYEVKLSQKGVDGTEIPPFP